MGNCLIRITFILNLPTPRGAEGLMGIVQDAKARQFGVVSGRKVNIFSLEKQAWLRRNLVLRFLVS